jgi:hypothetical protein
MKNKINSPMKIYFLCVLLGGCQNKMSENYILNEEIDKKRIENYEIYSNYQRILRSGPLISYARIENSNNLVIFFSNTTENLYCISSNSLNIGYGTTRIFNNNRDYTPEENKNYPINNYNGIDISNGIELIPHGLKSFEISFVNSGFSTSEIDGGYVKILYFDCSQLMESRSNSPVDMLLTTAHISTKR